MLMWLNKIVTIINTMVKILDIMNLRYIYIYIYIIFGFRIGTFNINMSFPYMQVYTNGPNGTK